MKVLQINNVHYRRGGADAVYLNTGELLVEHGGEVVYFNMLREKNLPCNDDKYFVSSIESRPKGLKSTLIELRNFFYNPEAARKIEELIIAEKPDIAHIHLFWGCGISASICKVLHKYNIPLVQTVHDYRMVCPIAVLKDQSGKVCEKCAKGQYYHGACKNCSHHGRLHSIVMSVEMYFHNWFFYPTEVVDGFIYVSNFSKKKHVQYMPKMQNANKTVLYNFSKSDSTKAAEKMDYFLYYGRLSHEKGIATLIDAFGKKPIHALKIVGTGPLEDELKEHCKEECYGNIDFLGYKSGEELFDLVQKAKFVCVPSEWYENNPMTIVESYTLGTPVIGAHIGGIPEIIEEGKTGYTFESGNVNDLLKTIQQADAMTSIEYEQMCANAKNFADENFEKEAHYKRLMEFYKQTINNYKK
ncbi:glycosyltransferase [Bacteroides graminisolvens]|uniref:glycosyltransferase n=1 Tax=Bacteroides graminisolvens TaxID=477666 RepID=UPI0023F0E196|nr:glycosyltransferase [Bacteroides graminisolvens]